MKKIKLNSGYIPLLITVALFVVLFLAGSVTYTGFFSLQVILNLFIDNSFLIIAALGETLVIISGGIDLSVGSVIALSTMIAAYLLTVMHLNVFLVIFIVLLAGLLIGLMHGILVTRFNFQPFIATLAGMFAGRGLCYVISTDTLNIEDPLFRAAAQYRIPMPGGSFISISAIIALAVLAVFIYIAHYTKFGRAVYAVGGSEQSARMMGLPVKKTLVLVYMLSGLTSAIAGIVFGFYMLSGYGLHALGLEMDAIAGVVIGGTLMTGGVGFVVGTMFGVLIEGIMQTLIMFQGTLNSFWTRIAIAGLLLIFIVVQRVIVLRRERNKTA
jgi:ribose/xylose/arabinose/galactoside ABC-type transport system permease subunit